MDDIEKAILISFDESGAIDSGLKSQAVAYCQQIKSTPNICSICIEKLRFCNLVQVQFWCLQCLHEVISVRYSALSVEELSMIRKSVFSMACGGGSGGDDNVVVRVIEGPAFVKNKLAQVFITLIYFEYPGLWASVFVDFLPHLSKGPVVIDMFCRILNALDDELISLDYPRSQEEQAVACRVKDAMRQQCVAQIVKAWYDVVTMYRSSEQELCANVLESMRRYISWIDIGLVANNVFIPLLFEMILADGLSEQLRAAAAGCVLAVVSKRMMDPEQKLSLLQSLQISRVFKLVAGDSDSELVERVGLLLTGYATEALECSKRVTSETAKSVSMELLDEVLPTVFFVMQSCEFDTTFNAVQFLSSYVGTMKSLSPLREKQLVHVGQILEVIRVQIRYDPTYRENLNVLDKIGREEEERMAEFRKDLFVLLRSVGRVAPDVTQMFIKNSFVNAVSSSSDGIVEDVEAALSLFFAFGEAINDEAMRAGTGVLGELIPILLSTKFPCHSYRLVALGYLETVTRYMKFVQGNTQYIPMVLAAFLDERGIHHENIYVRGRASYLFMRVVKLLKSKLTPFIERILQSLQDTLARFTTMDIATDALASQDGSHIFEAIGLLIGMEDVPFEKQSEYLSSLLTPLIQQVETMLSTASTLTPEHSAAKIADFQMIITVINSLSKGFSHHLVTASRPAIGLMFKQTLDVLLKILLVFPKVESLRSKVSSLIHRMVDTLGAAVFPYLPKALDQLLADSEPKGMIDFLLLINQLICKFNTSFHEILEEVFPAIAGRIFNIIPRNALPSGPGTNTEEIRELQELQRTLSTFLNVMATHGLSSVFLSPRCRVYLDPIMEFLLSTACNHKDILIRKASVQIFTRLIKDWCDKSYGEEKVPGFGRYIIETFSTNCCLYSVLDTSFEFHDANSLILFGEIVSAQKVMYEMFGDDFLAHFVSKGFPTAHCPQDLAQEYCERLRGSDIKVLRSFYQSLIEKIRVQQNGSLVFR